MFFSKSPNVEYDKKPLVFPFSEREYVLAKNFFRRVKVSDMSFASVLYYNKYTMTETDRFDLISQEFYGTTAYDWIIMLTNNIINPFFDVPIRESDLYQIVEKKYNQIDGIHHYETLSVKNSLGQEIQTAGLIVDQVFYNSTHKFYDRGTNTQITKVGNSISYPVSNYEHEKKLNDAKKEIYILRPDFINIFISRFENLMEYNTSASYIDKSTKKSGI
jgi:hypothetical protein